MSKYPLGEDAQHLADKAVQRAARFVEREEKILAVLDASDAPLRIPEIRERMRFALTKGETRATLRRLVSTNRVRETKRRADGLGLGGVRLWSFFEVICAPSATRSARCSEISRKDQGMGKGTTATRRRNCKGCGKWLQCGDVELCLTCDPQCSVCYERESAGYRIRPEGECTSCYGSNEQEREECES